MLSIFILQFALVFLVGLIVLPHDKKKSLLNLAILVLTSLLIIHCASTFEFISPIYFVLGGVTLPLQASHWGACFQALMLLAGILVLIMIRHETSHNMRASKNPEWAFLVIASLGGMTLVPVTSDIVSLWIALELATIPSFLMVAWDKTRQESGEAGIKFLLNSALATALFLLGLAFLYGITGSWDLNFLTNLSVPLNEGSRWVTVLILVAAAFKLGLVPFHLWVADAYGASPWPILAFLSLASKAVGLALLMKLFPLLGGLGPFFFAVVAALTMTTGNVAAVVQKNLRRLMAFSSISQVGYFLMAFVVVPQNTHGILLSPEIQSALVYYLLVYLVSNAVVLLGIAQVCRKTGRDNLTALSGLSQTQPLLALGIMIGLFSLAGIPPLAGFTGKFFLFNLAAKAGFNWLVGVAALNSTVSLYYYLQIVRSMYLQPAAGNTQSTSGYLYKTGLLVTTLATAVLGLIPVFDWLVDWLK